MSFLTLVLEQQLQVMTWTSVFIPYERWRLLVGILLIFAIMIWYLVNYKRATARNTFVYNMPYELKDAHAGSLNLLTYNIAGLPELISSAKTPRAESIRSIGLKVDQFDLVNVQEDFNYNVDLYQFNQHPYRTDTKGKVPFGDGLNTLSKYPIMELRRIPWQHCNGSDCLTPKGFAHMRVQLAKDVYIDLYNMHATAHTSKAAVQARRNNMEQLAEYINTHSEGKALLIMGDFNAHYAFMGDNIHSFKKQTGVVDPWVDFFLEGKIPEPYADFMIPHKLELTTDMESIDKILYRHGNDVKLIPKSYAIEDELFSTDAGEHLSDHLAISLSLDWEYIGDKPIN
ncbi:endonuclease [Sphingobacterium sp. lm-10]|uniref:endonuclease/exonuclease/phosphatase family protein n=1 Tax=Sphingobacterium sp. lm-10 TaxID=2944904 RepID=UPI0020206CAC|nr:endonuclease/exonuclease/phosphatase family protein [Sphingobacterium sp. lm-10]MCL7989117.1 endonuclease [Sphingobacterium sp. lm-10]